jgi:hypothetical protein
MPGKKKHKKKYLKDESSDIYNEDKQFEKQNIEDYRQVEFVYYDPTIFQEVDLFQAPVQDTTDSQEDDIVEDEDNM